jgi:hypothetical protein
MIKTSLQKLQISIVNFAFNMGIWRQIQTYLFIKKRDPNAPNTKFVKYMHGMNRISVLMFLACLIIILIRYVIIPLFR